MHSFQSDLWALGIVMYELATGTPPFASFSFNELVELIQKVIMIIERGTLRY